MNHEVSLKVLAEECSIVTLNHRANAFDENDEVAYSWNFLLAEEDLLGLKPFIKLASEDALLSKLFPFTSLYTLRFSRCTAYPFDTEGLPMVTPKQFEHFAPKHNKKTNMENDNPGPGPIFVVMRNSDEYLGEGNAAEALKIVKDHLPDPIAPARKGTAHD